MHIGTTARTPAGTIEAAVLIGDQPQPLYRRPGDGALFVAGASGQPYKLQARVLSGARAEVITAVDGRNTLKDEPGDARQNRGLVISGTGVFGGWRISDEEVREFVFGDPASSVAAQAGQPGNVGVIGFAAWRERYHAPPISYATLDTVPASYGPGVVTRSAGLGSVSGGGMQSSLGTGIGEARADHVGRTTFERSGEPDILVIRYDTPEALERAGITGPPEAQAFPGTGTGYERYAAP